MGPASLPGPLARQDWAGDGVLGRLGPRLPDPWCAGAPGPGRVQEGVCVFLGDGRGSPEGRPTVALSEQVRILSSPDPLDTPATLSRPGPPNLERQLPPVAPH